MSAPSLLPTAPSERLTSLDVLRGFALLGIFIMNMPGFGQSPFTGYDGTREFTAWYDQAVEVFRGAVLDGKFNSLLSFLFAIGFTLQLERLRRNPSAQGTRLYLRRVAVLLALGLIHGWIFWGGDVLHVYAVLGFALLAFHRLSDRALLGWIAGIFLLSTAAASWRIAYLPAEYWAAQVQMGNAWKASHDLAYGQGSFLTAVRETFRFQNFVYTAPEPLFYMMNFNLQMVTTMLLGLLAGRHRWIQRAPEFAARLPGLQWRLLAVGLALGAAAELGHQLRDPLHPGLDSIARGLAYRVSRPCVMGFYVVTILRLLQSERWAARLQYFAPVGRMPLTTYLSQTALGTAFFFHWGLGFWNQFGPLAHTLLALALFCGVQAPFSRWWLARHEYGPLEALWRRLTYGSLAASRASSPAAPPAAVELASR
ncbi:MAG: DUF418 domain-containing protein [Verrucomicrobia bacterium]|nr:DUF418 domain-containing protein [Verrucomicrobiota bacterium]